MEACLQNHPVTHNLRNLYDLRHFYIDANDIGQCTCGVAFESMMSILREHRLKDFCDQEWYFAVERSPNPIVKGYLAEHICLCSILQNGLSAVSSTLTRLDNSSFEAQPNWNNLVSTDKTRCLYILTAFNFRAVDGVILHVNHKSKSAHMYPIQITISNRFKNSDEDFYRSLWPTWVKPLEEVKFKVESTFVWIDSAQPDNGTKSLQIKTLRSGVRIV